MKAPALRALRARPLLLVLALGSAGCNILGFGAVPCTVDAHCPPGDVCGPSGVCRAPQGEGEGEGEGEPELCVTPAPEELRAIASLDVDPAMSGGTNPTLLRFLGQSPALHIDADHCAPDPVAAGDPLCPLLPTRSTLSFSRAPFAGRGLAAVELASGASVASAALNLDDGFVLEALVRVPSTPTGDPVVLLAQRAGSPTAPGDGYALFVDAAGALRFSVGAFVVTLLVDAPRVWTHVLCAADVPALRADAADGLVQCTVDGGPPAVPVLRDPAAFGAGDPTSTSALTLGGFGSAFSDGGVVPGQDGAIAFVHLFTGALPTRTAELRALTLQEGRRHFLAMHGLVVGNALDDQTAPGVRLLRGNTGIAPRVLALSALPDDADSTLSDTRGALLLVGPRWPRVVRSGADASAGILLEPARRNLVGALLASCNSERSPSGRRDACLVAAPVTLRTETNASVALSFYLQGGTGDGTVTVSPSGAVCRFRSDAAPSGCPAIHTESAVQETPDGAWTRVVIGPVEQVKEFTLAVPPQARVWALQLEAGRSATSALQRPSGTPLADLDDIALDRAADAMTFDPLDVGQVSAVSLEARVLPSSAAFAHQQLVHLDDDDDTADGFVELSLDGDLVSVRAVVEGLPAENPATPIPLVRPAEVAVAINGATPDCAPECAVTRSGTVMAPFQPRRLMIGGPETTDAAVLLRARLDSLGVQAPRTDLDLAVAPEDRACAGLVSPSVVLQMCDDGPCPNSSRFAATGFGLVEGPTGAELSGAGVFESTRALHFDAQLLELRLRTPPAAALAEGPVELLRLESAGTTVLALSARANASGGADLALFHAGTTTSVGEVAPFEWNQLVCALGPITRCVMNLSDVRAPLVSVSTLDIDRVVVGTPDTAIHTLRLFPIGRSDDNAATVELVAARAAASFAMATLPRRSPVRVRERREGPTTDRRLVDGGMGLFRLGVGWPRLNTDGVGLLYRAEPTLVDPLVDALDADAAHNGWDKTGVRVAPSVNPGPAGARAFVVAAQAGTSAAELSHLASIKNGVVSVFMRSLDDDVRVLLSDGVRTLSLPDGQLTPPGQDAGLLRYADGWVQGFLRTSQLSGRVRLTLTDAQGGRAAEGKSVVLAAPQAESDATVPGALALLATSAPVDADVRGGDGLELATADLTNDMSGTVAFTGRLRSRTGSLVGLEGALGLQRESYALRVVDSGGATSLSLAHELTIGIARTFPDPFVGVVPAPTGALRWTWLFDTVAVERDTAGGANALHDAAAVQPNGKLRTLLVSPARDSALELRALRAGATDALRDP